MEHRQIDFCFAGSSPTQFRIHKTYVATGSEMLQGSQASTPLVIGTPLPAILGSGSSVLQGRRSPPRDQPFRLATAPGEPDRCLSWQSSGWEASTDGTLFPSTLETEQSCDWATATPFAVWTLFPASWPTKSLPYYPQCEFRHAWCSMVICYTVVSGFRTLSSRVRQFRKQRIACCVSH